MLESIFNGMNASLLTVNPDKSTSIPISHNSKKKNFSINVTYNNIPIENVSSSSTTAYSRVARISQAGGGAFLEVLYNPSQT